MEYLCLLAEIETLKEENAHLRRKDSVCPFITTKGTQCTRKCDGDKNACKIHDRSQKVPKCVCTGMNMRGNPCKRKCVDGKTHCEKHDPSVQKVPKCVCTGMNMRGNPCKRKCVDGKTHCEKHDPSVQGKQKAQKMHIEHLNPVDDKKWVSEVAFWAARNDPRMI
jgi:hypothetical protein